MKKRFFLLLLAFFTTHPLMAEEKKEEAEAAKPEEGEHKPEKKEAKKDDKDLPENKTSVKLEVSVSRFSEDKVASLVSYLFYFQVNSYEMREKIYGRLLWFKGEIIPKLTAYLSNPAHDPKDQREVKRFLLKLTNKILNERFGEKDEKGEPKKDEKGKPIYRKFVTEVFINKIFERKF